MLSNRYKNEDTLLYCTKEAVELHLTTLTTTVHFFNTRFIWPKISLKRLKKTQQFSVDQLLLTDNLSQCNLRYQNSTAVAKRQYWPIGQGRGRSVVKILTLRLLLWEYCHDILYYLKKKKKWRRKNSIITKGFRQCIIFVSSTDFGTNDLCAENQEWKCSNNSFTTVCILTTTVTTSLHGG